MAEQDLIGEVGLRLALRSPAIFDRSATGMGPKVPTAAVQVATLEGVDPDLLAAHIHYVDGLHNAFDKQPADTRLL